MGIAPTNLVNVYRVTLDLALQRIYVNADGLIVASWKWGYVRNKPHGHDDTGLPNALSKLLTYLKLPFQHLRPISLEHLHWETHQLSSAIRATWSPIRTFNLTHPCLLTRNHKFMSARVWGKDSPWHNKMVMDKWQPGVRIPKPMSLNSMMLVGNEIIFFF